MLSSVCVMVMRQVHGTHAQLDRGEIFFHFMQMQLTWGPSTWALASCVPLLSSLILLYVSQDRLLTAIGQKKAFSHSLVFTRDTRNRDREKSSGQTHLFNIWTIGAKEITPGQPQVELSLLCSICLKILPLERGNVMGWSSHSLWGKEKCVYLFS
jgi:hypothetical protein